MTDLPAAAVQIAESALPLVARSGEIAIVRAAVAALARVGWLHDPPRVAALEKASRRALATLDLIAQPGYNFTEWPANDLRERRAQRAAAQKSADELRAVLTAEAAT